MIRGILLFYFIQIFTKIGNQSSFLVKTTLITVPPAFVSTCKKLLKFGKAKIGCLIIFFFNNMKFLLASTLQ